MKKILAFIIAVAMGAGTLVSCVGVDTTVTSETTNTTAKTTVGTTATPATQTTATSATQTTATSATQTTATSATQTTATSTTQTTATVEIPTQPQVFKIVNKAEYEVLEAYGYDNILHGKHRNDIYAGALPKNVTEVLLCENGEMSEETIAKILQKYNADVTELSLAPITSAVNARNEYNFEEFHTFEITDCKIGFMEIDEGKFAVEYKMRFHIVRIEGSNNWIGEFRHFVIYLN